MLKFVATGKEEKDCMYEQTGLGLFIFDENRFVSFLSFGSLNILNPHGKFCESEKLEFFKIMMYIFIAHSVGSTT
jgi:hypothetical protein